MQFINLTPHALNLHTLCGGVVNLPVSGEAIPRLDVTREARPNCGPFGVCSPTMGEVSDLPGPREGVVLIVSALVAEKVRRADVMSPGELVRDEAGRPVGAKGLCSFA